MFDIIGSVDYSDRPEDLTPEDLETHAKILVTFGESFLQHILSKRWGFRHTALDMVLPTFQRTDVLSCTS